MAIVTAGHDSELRSVELINKRDAFEGRGLGVALVDEVFILVVSGQEGANKKEPAMCARNDGINSQVIVDLGVGVGGLDAVEGVEGRRRWISDPEGDLHGMVVLGSGSGRGVVPTGGDVPLVREENRRRPRADVPGGVARSGRHPRRRTAAPRGGEDGRPAV